MPGYPSVSNPRLGLLRSSESAMISDPDRSLLTKKIAPPPSFAVLSVIRVPQTRSVYVLPSFAIAPPFPPPGVPACAGFAPSQIASLCENTELSTV